MIAVVFRGTKERADWAANLNTCRRDCPATWGDDPGALHEVRSRYKDTLRSTGWAIL